MLVLTIKSRSSFSSSSSSFGIAAKSDGVFADKKLLFNCINCWLRCTPAEDPEDDEDTCCAKWWNKSIWFVWALFINDDCVVLAELRLLCNSATFDPLPLLNEFITNPLELLFPILFADVVAVESNDLYDDLCSYDFD